MKIFGFINCFNSRIFNFIQDITNISIFIQFISTSLTQIAFGYYAIISSSTINYVDAMRYFGQFVSITIETLLPCYYGEKIRTAQDELAMAIYEMKWYEQEIRFRRYFVLFLLRAQKDVFLMAGNQIPVNLKSFLKVFFIRDVLLVIIEFFFY